MWVVCSMSLDSLTIREASFDMEQIMDAPEQGKMCYR